MKMKFNKWLDVAFLIAGMAMFSETATAQVGEKNEESAKKYQISIGGGFYGILNPYLGAKEEPETGLLPWVSIENDRMSLDPSGLEVKVYQNDIFKAEAIIAPRWVLADPSDLEGLEDVKRSTGVDLGARLSTRAGPLIASVTYKGDVSGVSKGHEINAGLSTGFQVSKRLGLGVETGVYWRDKDLSQYMFGVFEDEVQSFRPEYKPGDTVTPYAGIAMNYAISKNVSAVIAIQGELFGDKIKDSPIIGRDETASSFMALYYSF